MKEDSVKICRIKCNTCGRLLGTYMFEYNNGCFFLPGLLDDDASNINVGATSQIRVNGKIRKIYCTEPSCASMTSPFISIEGDGQ